MPARLSLALAVASGLLFPCAVTASSDKASPLSIEVPGSVLTDALRQAFAKHLASPALPATFSSWDGRLSTVQQREAAGAPEPDVLLTPNAATLAGCREGLLMPLDWSSLGTRSDYPGASQCGLPGFSTALVLAWDKTRDQTPPGWGDFWDVARYPGKRGLPRQARATLEIALMADGVSTGDVYRVLASSEGVARAFRKLDQLRPYVVWWTDGAAAIRALTSGGVMMTAAPATYAAAGKGTTPATIGQQWTQALSDTLSWVVPRRAPDPAASSRFLRLLQQQPDWQAAVTSIVPVVGVSQGVQSLVDPDLLTRTAVAPHRAGQMLAIDDAFWSDHPELSSRFDAWLAAGR